MGKEITISLELYEELLAAQEKLYALEAFGVDNWGGYEDAMSSLDEPEDEET